jgi:predicted metal-dependent phosphoesterase TrpH
LHFWDASMLKVDLHTHTADDPADLIPHRTAELVDAAAAAGYDAVAVTLHDHQLDLRPWAGHARDRGIVLIPGVERTIQGKHLLLLNFPAAADTVATFDELRRLKERFGGFVVAPHPFYPTGSCLQRRLMDAHADLFDAVEFTYYYTRGTALFNERAVRWAAAHGLPVVGNGDVHRLSQLGKTFSLVDAEPSAESILAAIRAGRVELRTGPIPAAEAAGYMSSLLWAGWKQAWRGPSAPTEPLATND